MEHLEVDGAQIEYAIQGNGEPVLLIPLSVIIDGLACPLFSQPELASRYRLIHYHRRGYMGSTLGHEPLTADRQASDAAALLKHLGVKSAHVVGTPMGDLSLCNSQLMRQYWYTRSLSWSHSWEWF